MNDNILVTIKIPIGQKNRICLTKSVGAREGDKLVLIIRKNYLEVKELHIVRNELLKLKERLGQATNIEISKFYQDNIDLITSCISNVVEVDKQGRIILPSEIIERYRLSKEIVIEGIMDGFRIWNPSDFEEYQTAKINKFSRK